MAKKRAHRPQGRPAPRAPQPRTTRPTPPPTPTRSARTRFEDASRPVLLRMRALPGFVIPVLLAVLLLLGLIIRAPWAGWFLVVIGAFLTWLTALSWPVITPGSRLLRGVVNLGVLVLGILKLLGMLG